MLKNHPTTPSLDLLPNIFSQFPMVQAVYLFGSTANGHRHAESDLDLAILPYRGEPRPPKLDLLTALARHGFCNVDLVFLDTTDIVLKYEAIRKNYLVYQCDDFDEASYYSKIVRQYLDFLPYLAVQRQAYKEQLLRDQKTDC